jgi:hypothetical protein
LKNLFELLYKFRIPLILFWSSLVFILTLFYPFGGDETGYFYSSKLFSVGEIPILDFFALQPLGFFMPYAAVARWFSDSAEAMKLVSAFSCIMVPLLTALLVCRHYGRTLAVYGFFIIAFSHWFFYWNIQIIHYSITNLCLVVAIFTLFYFRSRFFFFLAGLAMGWAINSRLSLGPAGVALFFLSMTHVGETSHNSWMERFLKKGAPFALGGIIASLPMLAVLIEDHKSVMYDLFYWRLGLKDSRLPPEGIWFIFDYLKIKLKTIVLLFGRAVPGVGGYYYPKSMVQNLLLAITIVFIAIIYLMRPQEIRKTWKNEISRDPLLKVCLWLIIVIVLSHFFTVMPTSYYIQHIFPLITIVILGTFFHGGMHSISPSIQSPDGWVLRALIILLIPYVFYHLAFSSLHLIRRNVPNLWRPVTAAHVGCWIEKNTPVNDVVMGWVSLPIPVAGRRLPRGFEYPPQAEVNVGSHFPINEKTAKRFKLFRSEDFQEAIISGRYRILLIDYQFISFLESEGVLEAWKGNYHLFATTGGGKAFSRKRYDIYLRNDQKDKNYTKMLPMNGPYPLEQLVQFLKGNTRPSFLNKWELLQKASKESLISISLLPTDVYSAWNRLIQAPHLERCPEYPKIKKSLHS